MGLRILYFQSIVSLRYMVPCHYIANEALSAFQEQPAFKQISRKLLYSPPCMNDFEKHFPIFLVISTQADFALLLSELFR